MRTGVMLGPSWLLVLLVWGLNETTRTQAQEVWEPKKFLEPTGDYASPSVVFSSDSDESNARINLDENAFGVILAVINYKGDSLPRSTLKTSLEEDYVRDPVSKYWLVNATRGLDFDAPGTATTIRIIISIIGMSDIGILFINLQNINDNVPIWEPISPPCQIKEGITGKTDCFITVTDLDGAAEDMTYISSSPLFDVFIHEVLSPRAVVVYIHVTAELDFETISVYSITINVNDNYLGVTWNQAFNYLVKVEDVADENPMWTNIFSAQTIFEKQLYTFQVTAIDGDLSKNEDISYSLNSPNSNITIDETSGLLTVSYIDRDTEKIEVYKLVVTAFETNDHSSFIESEIVILVNDINDNIPAISPDVLVIKLEEETSMTLEFDEAIMIRDPDLGNNGAFSVKIEDSFFSPCFLLVPNTGYQEGVFSISVINQAELNFDRTDKPTPEFPKIILTITVTEVGNETHTASKDVVIELQDRNDESPVFTEKEYFTEIPENIKKDDFIIDVLANDDDYNDILSYTINQRVMTVDKTTGRVTVLVDNAFDYERQKDMIVQVTVTDDVGQRGYADIRINITDINDEAPILEMPTEILSVIEHSDVTIANIKASDEDTDAELTFDIDWDSSYATKQGARILDSSKYDGCLKLTGTLYNGREWTANLVVNDRTLLDWEVFDALFVSVVVTDNATDINYLHMSTARALLSLAINDINDSPPKFNEFANMSVLENSHEDQVIGRVIATDDDGPNNNEITYTIEPVNVPPGMVKIIDTSGELQVDNIKNIDCEEYHVHEYMVYANDTVNFVKKSLTIYIRDQNDETPMVWEYDRSPAILENSQNSSIPITTVNATDDDYSIPFSTLTFLLKNFDTHFRIDSATGELFVELKNDAELDREKTPTFDIVVIIRDNFQDGLIGNSFSTETTINLILLDENDNDPVFPELPGACLGNNLLEDLAKDVVIYEDLTATDADIGENAEITYKVISITALTNTVQDPVEVNKYFRIETKNKKSGDIITNQEMIDRWGKYNIILGAYNQDPNHMVNHSYTICISDINNHPPVFEWPQEGEQIRINNDQKLNMPLIDKYQERIKNFVATDLDDMETDNAKVNFTVTGDEKALLYFDVQTLLGNEGYLFLHKQFDSVDSLFNLEIEASDNGNPVQKNKINIEVIVIYTEEVPPVFIVRESHASFTENVTGMNEYYQLPTATDKNNENLEPGEAGDPIYYHLAMSNNQLFNLDKESGKLSLFAQLDYETEKQHILWVYASNKAVYNGGEINTDDPSVLKVIVEVKDVNDMPPRFVDGVFIGGFSSSDNINKEVAKLEAHDPDVDDEVTYTIIEVTGSNSFQDKNNAFKLDSVTGSLTLNFEPAKTTLDGHFALQVKATDLSNAEGHEDMALVQIFVITDANKVKFTFSNPPKNVSDVVNDVREVFSTVFGYSCGIDRISDASDESGRPVENEADVDAHFVNATSGVPVESSVITNQMNNGNTLRELTITLSNLGLVLKSVDSANNNASESVQEFLQIILIAVSVVLGAMVVILFVAFFVRTRTLNRRLEALSTTKFGSQDSGLNRIGKVPNTNKHAVEGSNPVWNEDVEPDYDNMSEGSGDSDLIGIEDNPEFSSYYNNNNNTDNFNTVRGTENGGFNMDSEQGFPRRTSVNPLSNLGVEGDIRRMSVNPLAASNSIDNSVGSSNFSFPNADNLNYSSEPQPSQTNSNFMFGKPATEL